MNEQYELYKHYYSGHCSPNSTGRHTSMRTFSVGIFQALPKASGKGVKKSAVKYRIRGSVHDAATVYARAEQVCSMLDKGWVPGNKSETLSK